MPIKFLLLGGGGGGGFWAFFRRGGGGGANFIFMGVGINTALWKRMLILRCLEEWLCAHSHHNLSWAYQTPPCQ